MTEIIKHTIDTPIMIPSLKRYTDVKNPKLMIDVCLNDLFRHYNATAVHVLAQEYNADDIDMLTAKYPNVTFRWKDKRMGIINTFENLKNWGVSLGYGRYIHYDDDVKMTQQFSMNPTLVALNHVMDMNPKRIGIVTASSIGIHHFSKQIKRFVRLHSNPAQLLLINCEPASKSHYDNQFSNFRSDTDFTMQFADHGYIPIMLMRHFSFMHTVPMAFVDKSEGKHKFKTLDNITNSKGSVGGARSEEIRRREFDAFQKKWPYTITHRNYRQQVFKKSIIKLTNHKPEEMIEYEDAFDYTLIKKWKWTYYGTDQVEYKYYKQLLENNLI